jgi:dihydroneopterin aldolase
MIKRGVVRIRNLEFQGKHGASAAERKSARRFQVDVDLEFDVARAVASDRLADTLDYDHACRMLVEIGTAHPHHLLESVAGEMLDALKARWPSSRVELEVRKLHPPCPGNPSYTAVRLTSE